MTPADGTPTSKEVYGTRSFTGADLTIANLFDAVKANDPEFKPHSVNKDMLNPDGTPKVVYHATDAEFTVFDAAKLGENTAGNASDKGMHRTAQMGFWFNERDLREDMATNNSMAVYVRIKRPYRTNLHTLSKRLERMRPETLKKNLMKQGYDGLVVKDQEFGGYSYVVFESTQIKSATDNIGTFDPENSDIRYSPRVTDTEVERMTPKQIDEGYMAAVRTGADEGQLMTYVDEIARRRGYLCWHMYHVP